MPDELPVLFIGLDLVDVERLRKRIEHDPDLADELFHRAELGYAHAQRSPYEHLAARFAAKEAVVKALGLDGWDPLDIEIIGGGEALTVRLDNGAALRATALGVTISVSLSHLDCVAGAVALARRTEQPGEP